MPERKQHGEYLTCRRCRRTQRLQRAGFERRNGVCPTCWHLGNRYMELAVAALARRRGGRSGHEAAVPPEVDPGREGRIRVYEARAAAGLPIFRDDDPWMERRP